MDDLQNKKLMDTSYSDEDLFVLLSYRAENEKEAQEAFRIFYERYKRLLWSLCFNVCAKLDIENGEELAEYVFSDTMMAIYNHPTYDSRKGKLSTWMSRIAKNKASDLLKEYRMNDVRNISLDEAITVSDEDVDEIQYDTPEKKILDDALRLLSERDREILLTCYMYKEDKKHLPDEVINELSLRYSTTPANIRQIQKRSLEKLKAYISNNSNFQTINLKKQ